MPLETISGAGRTSRREAGTTAASLEIAPTCAKISAVFFAIESASEAAFDRGLNRKEDRGEKIKERPMAADEKIGEADILSRYCQLAIDQGMQRAGSARANLLFSSFIRLREYRSPSCRCQGGPA